ncbi:MULTISPECIES: hypothetical protein [Actinomadura]|uniref:Uncharacterized protein n=2 Tax=Actinomadura madurae TaxID=1993 RepID=A0A1I5XDI0_9ACTN|nr:hypothetical protein [Actinomadura madurae]MCP9953606.1 hypothetical protein [Actinomadura madurae]MCP9982842.1 hypothetical protein [Actinomadura madurae]MCQ0005607.1 hypothetical protein [Actinomadura madurae]MCQ0019075.1 hypothetical protein [Actinomadura madurae]URM99093.1 hypothetical protein LUW76_34850 [Actinomadura madurae]
MRRIAAVALTAGTLMAGMAAVSAPAEAAATGNWKPYDSYGGIYTWGKYSRSGGSTAVTGYLRDTKKNGWTACVRFLFTEGSKKYYSRFKIVGVTSGGTKYNFDGKATVKISVKSSYGSHMWVQECGRNKKTGKYYYGKGRKIF